METLIKPIYKYIDGIDNVVNYIKSKGFELYLQDETKHESEYSQLDYLEYRFKYENIYLIMTIGKSDTDFVMIVKHECLHNKLNSIIINDISFSYNDIIKENKLNQYLDTLIEFADRNKYIYENMGNS